jgi:hypothetical protein
VRNRCEEECLDTAVAWQPQTLCRFVESRRNQTVGVVYSSCLALTMLDCGKWPLMSSNLLKMSL